MGSSEPRRLLVAFNHGLARHKLKWVLFVLGEFPQAFIIASFGRVRWLEGNLVFHRGPRLCLGLTVRNRDVLAVDSLVRVELVRLLSQLREGLLLLLRFESKTLSSRDLLGGVVVVRTVLNCGLEEGLLANLPLFGRVGQEVSGRNLDDTILVLEVLLNVRNFLSVIVGGVGLEFGIGLLGGLESAIVTSFNVAFLIGLSHDLSGSFLEGLIYSR